MTSVDSTLEVKILCACGCGSEIPKGLTGFGVPRMYKKNHHTRVTSNRMCYACGATKTYVSPNGKPNWFKNRSIANTRIIIGYLCRRCYKHYYEELHRDKNKDRLYDERGFWFKDKVIHNKQPPRIGVCNWCRAVKGQIDAQVGKLCKNTQIHHEQYHDLEPLKDGIELCARCHGKKTSPNGRIMNGKVKERWKDKDCVCYGCGMDVKEGRKTQDRWVFNEPTSHVLCGNCDCIIRYYTRKCLKQVALINRIQ